MTISILTLFPKMFEGPLSESIVARARKQKLVQVKLVNIRDFAQGSYKTVDDHPYGGGVGMVMRVDVIEKALKRINVSTYQRINVRTILLDPQGTPYTQKKAQSLSKLDHLILICGHYEGIDERIRGLVDEEISIGDYILTGGEIPAMALVDSVTRLLPGVLKNPEATRVESFSANMLEYPQYTRPEVYKNQRVPAVLLSGDHQKITAWRLAQAQLRTGKRRPDLVKKRKG